MDSYGWERVGGGEGGGGMRYLGKRRRHGWVGEETEHERSRQEKEVRGGWVRRQSMRDPDKRRRHGVGG